MYIPVYILYIAGGRGLLEHASHHDLLVAPGVALLGYETEMYTYPPINTYSIYFKTGILHSKELVYMDKS